MTSLLAAGLKVRFRARGHSMGPSVRDGEPVTVAPLDARGVTVGDIVLCETGRSPLAHRVQSIGRGATGIAQLVLRGDASLEDDRPVTAGQVRGHLVTVERAGRALTLVAPGGAIGKRLLVAALRARASLAAVRARLVVAALPLR